MYYKMHVLLILERIKRGFMSSPEEKFKLAAVKEVELRNSIATIVSEDLWFQEEIENILDDRFPKYLNRRETPTSKEENEINKHLIDVLYSKVESVLNCKHDVSDMVNDRNAKILRLTRGSMMKIKALYTQRDKVEVERIQQKKGRGRPMPPWLLSLKKGQYTVDELVKISQTVRRNVQQTMKRHCKKISYVDIGDVMKKCVYHWDPL